MRRLACYALLAVGLGLPTTADAQDWNSVFPERSHDFGTVARGSKVKHAFRLVNNTGYTLHIAGWNTRCGCTDVKVGAREIPAGTQTFVEATLDTTKFVGYKPSGLTITFDQPQYITIDLNLSCFIRSDVVVNPGVADFGVVNRTSGATQTLTLSYAGGQPNWGVVGLRTMGDHITARLEEISGSRQGGSVQYQLAVALKPTAPIGYLKEEITLETNDPSSPRIPISVTGQVQGNVVISPSILPLGTVRAGETKTLAVLVRSAQPFAVEGVESEAGGLTGEGVGGEESKPIHRLAVKFTAPSQTGPFHGTLLVKTSLADEPAVELPVFATVVP